MTDKQPPDSRQPAEPAILRDVVEPLTPRKPLKAAAQKPAKSPDESQPAGQPERDGHPAEFLDKYDLSRVEEQRRERRLALAHSTSVQAITSASSRPPGAG